MEDQIKRFVNVSSGPGYLDNYEDGYKDGSGLGRGKGLGCGHIDGGLSGGRVDDDGCDSGKGYGLGEGTEYGDGYGWGACDSGEDIKMFNGDQVYMIDFIPTIIKSIRNNVAKGFILNDDFTLEETFVVKEKNQFAHGRTLHEAFLSLQEKLYDDSTEEERIEAFKEHFKDFSVEYPAMELFTWHHVLTGSCMQGRLNFCQQRDIDLETDMFTVYEFINLTRDSYGGEIIRKLEND